MREIGTAVEPLNSLVDYSRVNRMNTQIAVARTICSMIVLS